MPSTQNLNQLLPVTELRQVCKAIAVLDAIVCQEWEYRYYSYNSKWAEREECASMRNGCGDQYHILFNEYGAVISGFAHESEMSSWRQVEMPPAPPTSFKEKLISFFVEDKEETEDKQNPWKGLYEGLPNVFDEFIFGEPVKSIGTTFCIWRSYGDNAWHIGGIEFPDNDYKDGSADLLELLDGNPKKYKEFAEQYFEDNEEGFPILPFKAIKAIYNGEVLNRKLVHSINPNLEDWGQLIEDLEEIDYPHEIEI